MTTTPAVRHTELCDRIRRHDRLYYALNSPEITNKDYDELMAELTEMERHDPRLVMRSSPTQRIGQPVPADFPRVDHPEPMLALHTIHTQDEFLAWHQHAARTAGVTSFSMMIEPETDGLALRLEYLGRDLSMAATQGDGHVGEEVSPLGPDGAKHSPRHQVSHPTPGQGRGARAPQHPH